MACEPSCGPPYIPPRRFEDLPESDTSNYTQLKDHNGFTSPNNMWILIVLFVVLLMIYLYLRVKR